MSNIVIDIAAQFTGKKAFSASEKAINNLSKSIKRAALGGGIATLMASSVKAFAEDEKAAAMLGNTLKNLGLNAFTASVEAMIDKTQLATGVLDEQLRPAFQKLVTSTGNAIQAQELLKLALDVSAGSGNDLVTVASDISNVMAGNNKGLKKYALGLSAVELKTMSATEVQIKFLEVYGGASEKASKTFAGSLLRIKASVEMARESLGKGLVDGLMIATGSQNIDELQKKIVDFGTSAGNAFKTLGGLVKENLGLLKSLAITFAAIWTAGKVIAGIATVTKLVAALTASYKLLRATAVGAAIAQAALLNPLAAIAYGAALVATITAATLSIDNLGKLGASIPKPTGGGGFTDSQNAARLEAEKKARAAADKALKDKLAKEKAAAKAAAAAIIASNKKATAAQIAADKKAAAQKAILAKADSMFNLDQIQIEAALKGKISENERLRLELQRAILNEDFELADKLQKKLEASQRAINALQGQLNDIKPPVDPFAETLKTLESVAAILAKITGMPITLDPGKKGGGILGLEPEDLLIPPSVTKITGDPIPVVVAPSPTPTPTSMPDTNVSATPASTGPFYGKPLPGYMTGMGDTSITVIVEGNVLDGDDFTNKVNDALLNANRTGLPRTAAGFLVSQD